MVYCWMWFTHANSEFVDRCLKSKTKLYGFERYHPELRDYGLKDEWSRHQYRKLLLKLK